LFAIGRALLVRAIEAPGNLAATWTEFALQPARLRFG
jgi:hypothetical protein